MKFEFKVKDNPSLRFIDNDNYVMVLDWFLQTNLLTMSLEERKSFIETWILKNQQAIYISLLVESKYLTYLLKNQIKKYTDEAVSFDVLMSIDDYCDLVWKDLKLNLTT